MPDAQHGTPPTRFDESLTVQEPIQTSQAQDHSASPATEGHGDGAFAGPPTTDRAPRPAGSTVWEGPESPDPSPTHATNGSEPIPFGDADAPGPAGRYRPLRLYARGGLGEVFVARDEEVGRDVALKSLQGRHADDPIARARFDVEAKITGKLEHPGIVAVHGLGRDAAGRPFYAMRLIRGESLADAIGKYHRRLREAKGLGRRRKGRPADPFRDLEFRNLLSRFVAVCNAVAYAHSQGVVHRDLKPGNVMLGPYGETLVVDWGLAKYVASASGATETQVPDSGDLLSSDHQTAAGQVLGTPAYMSPEQAAGRPELVGPASDIYSLGATLFHLLAGRPPVEEGAIGEVLRRVQAGEFPAPRRVRPEVPRALEAVCLKAMALRPEDRYGSAGELAGDVERWLADEPIRAAAEPLDVRLRRWTRRHRPLVAGAAALLVTASLAAGVGAVLLAKERTVAVAARERSDRNFRLAGEAVDKYLRQVTDSPRLQKADAVDLRRKLLASAVPFFTRILEQDQGDPDPKIRADRGKAHARLAFLHSQMADAPAALRSYTEAINIFTQLVAEQPDELAWQEELSGALDGRAGMLADAHKFAESEPDYRAAITIQERHIRRFPGDHVPRGELARVLSNFGNVFRKAGYSKEAEAQLRSSVALMEQLAADHPEIELYRLGIGPVYHNLAQLMRETGRPAEAERYFRAALRVQEELVKARPEADIYRRDLGVTYDALALFLRGVGKHAEAEAAYRKSAEVHGALAADFPSQTTNHDHLASSYWSLGMMLRESGRAAKGDSYVEKALAIGERLARENPHSAELACRIAGARWDEGHWHRKGGRYDAALRSYDQALAGLEDFLRHHKSSPAEYAYRSATVHRSRLLADLGRAREAVAGVERLLARAKLPVQHVYDAATILAAAAANVKDDPAAAPKLAERAVSLLKKAVDAGYLKDPKRRNLLETDPALAPLRELASFERLKRAVDSTHEKGPEKASPRAADKASAKGAPAGAADAR